jgi:hypothetical protein
MIASAPVSARSVDSTTGWRFYEVNGEKHVSVTQVLEYFVDQNLKNWFIKTSPKAGEKRKTETASQGSAIHQAAHEGKEDRLNALMEELGMVTVASEIVCYSKNGWAGQADRIVTFKGKNYVVDIKTGRFGNAECQLGAYSLALNEHGHDIQGMGVISLPRDLTQPARYFDYTDYEDYPTMEDNQYAWCACFDAWKRHYYKQLEGWPFYPIKTTLNYQWSFK